MQKLTRKTYRHKIIGALILISVCLFLDIFTLILSFVSTFFDQWHRSFYDDTSKCPKTTYNQYLPLIDYTEIIFVVMVGITCICCFYSIISLLICYQHLNKFRQTKWIKNHNGQVIALMICLTTSICALLHLITMYTQIQIMKSETENSSDFYTTIITYCLTKEKYETTINKLKQLLPLIIIQGVILLLLLISILLIVWLLIKTRNLRERPKVKKLEKTTTPRINKNKFDCKILQQTFQPFQPKVIQVEEKTYRETGIGEQEVAGMKGVDMGIETSRVEKEDKIIEAVVKTKDFGFGETLAQKQESGNENQSSFHIHRTELSQYHMNHPQEMKASKLRANKFSLIEQSQHSDSEPEEKLQLNLRGYFDEQQDQEQEDDRSRHEPQKFEQTQKINISESKLPYQVHINRQYVQEEPLRNHSSQGSVKNSMRKSSISSLLQKKRQQRNQIFQPIGLKHYIAFSHPN